MGGFRGVICALLLAAPIGFFAPGATPAEPCRKPTTLLVVRHADRPGSDDALSPAGVERAHDLARAVGKAGITAIYVSDTERARLTAEPLASTLRITPVERPGKDVDGLLKHILEHHCGETVLIVGHSNTVPMIIAAAGGPALPDLAENAFDDLFVLTVEGGAATLVNLRYGAATP